MMVVEEDAPLPCAEKLAFDTKKAADTAATVTYHRYGSRVKSYRCQHCHLWHLASI